MSTLTTDTNGALPYDDDEDEDEDFLPHDVKQGRFNAKVVSRLLFVGLLLVGSFAGGIAVQKNNTPVSTGRGGAGGAARFGGGAGAAAFAGRGGGGGTGGGTGAVAAGGGTTAGVVKVVDGNTIYVTDVSGNVVKVTTDAGSAVTKTATGTVADAKPGDTVTVTGSKGPDGSFAAQSVTLSNVAAAAIAAANGN